MRSIAFVIGCLLLASCVSTERLKTADYGPPPINPQKQVVDWLHDHLKDPDSAKVEYRRLLKGWIRDGLIMGGKVHYGWILPVSVNSKNGFGAYTGFKDYDFFFDGGLLYADAHDYIYLAHMGGFYGE